MPSKKEVKKQSNKSTVELHTQFELVYEENAKNVAVALCRCGYLVNIVKSGSAFLVNVYKQV
jgi:hypothetical protein